MKQTFDGIDFPANPFVVLVDFLLLFVLVLLLSVLQQSVASSQWIERMAVSDLQKRLENEVKSHPNLSKLVLKTWTDGDLQRFWLDGKLLFATPHSIIVDSPEGMARLSEIGSIFKKYQGNPLDPGSGLYKRIIIEGHSSISEGSTEHTWALSLQRANSALNILQGHSGLAPQLLEASGRGCWLKPYIQSGWAVRIEIVVAYSGGRSMKFMQSLDSPSISK